MSRENFYVGQAEQEIESWLALFDHVMRLRPDEVPIKAIIEHSFAIRDVGKAAIKELRGKQ